MGRRLWRSRYGLLLFSASTSSFEKKVKKRISPLVSLLSFEFENLKIIFMYDVFIMMYEAEVTSYELRIKSNC